MITNEQDSDVVRWGLQLFDGDPYSNCGYCGSVTQPNTDYYPGYYSNGYQYNAECCDSENHELNLNGLHEDLSQLSVTEPNQTSVCSQEWFPQSLGNYAYGTDSSTNFEWN